MSKKLFDEEIENFSKAMQKRLIEKQDEKGDSWKNVSLWELLDVLGDKSEQIINDHEFDNPDDEMKHLVDLANYCMLLYIRLDEWKKDI